MLFNSFSFFIFFVIFFIIYYSLKGNLRIYFCLASSYLFYSFFSLKFLSLIFFSTLIDFIAGKKIDEAKDTLRIFYLFLSIFLNLLILGIFKYYNFFIDSVANLLLLFDISIEIRTLNIILPVGISFYTFQSMSYTLDIYFRRCKVEKKFLTFATFVSFFPQLVAGPIVRAKKFLPQLNKNLKFRWCNFFLGFEYIIFGFFLKLCVADRLGIVVDPTFLNPESFGGLIHMISTIFFSFQIYADFGGYSLIAIGVGRILGFNFGINFKRPYLASSFQDFWRRWHISLSRWLKDYLYIPLGGNRYGTLNKYKSLLVVMFLGGLWHGASVNFIIWGMFHGILLIINDFLKKKKISLSQNLNKLIVFFVVSILWIIFRSDNLLITKLKFKKLCEFETFFQNFTYDLFNLLIGFTMILIVLSKDFLEERKIRMSKNYRIILSLIFIWLISFVGIFEGSNFIYFKF